MCILIAIFAGNTVLAIVTSASRGNHEACNVYKLLEGAVVWYRCLLKSTTLKKKKTVSVFKYHNSGMKRAMCLIL